MGPLQHPPRHDPKITIGGQAYDLVGVEFVLGGRRLKSTRRLSEATADRIQRGVAKHLSADAQNEATS